MSVPSIPLAVVGAGPCGIGVGVAARQRGVDCLLFDKSCVVSAITNYPTHMTFFSTAERLEMGGVPFTTTADKPARREAIKYYQRIVKHFQLDVHQYEEVIAVSPVGAEFRLDTVRKDGTPRQYYARRVVIATGYLDTPVLMNVPGENLDKVTHYYREGSQFFDQDCVVIGGGNSSVDAALDLYKWGARVTLIHFADSLDPGVKPWILPDIVNRIKNGEITARWNSRVIEIHENYILVEDAEGRTDTIPNDWFFAMTGYRPDPRLLRSLGVEIDRVTGIPSFDPATMETNRSGVYIAGVIAAGHNANKIFIENGRDHGPRIVAHALGS